MTTVPPIEIMMNYVALMKIRTAIKIQVMQVLELEAILIIMKISI